MEFRRFLRYGLPPLAGGQRDQPAGWFERGEALYAVEQLWRAYQAGDQTAAWRRDNADLYEWGRQMEREIEVCQTR